MASNKLWCISIDLCGKWHCSATYTDAYRHAQEEIIRGQRGDRSGALQSWCVEAPSRYHALKIAKIDYDKKLTGRLLARLLGASADLPT